MKVLIVIIIVVVVGFVGFLIFQNSDNDAQNENRDFDKVKDFSLEDYEGNTVTLSDFEGKALVLNSWATWCPFCKDELPDFAALQEEFSEEIAVIAIDRQESLELAKEYTDTNSLTGRLTFLLDPTDSFYNSIGGFSMPETLFVDADGNIRIHKRGPMDLDEMREKVNSILNN